MKFQHVILPRVLALALCRSHPPRCSAVISDLPRNICHSRGAHLASSFTILFLVAAAGGPGPGGDGGRREKVQKGEQVQIVGTLTVGLREVRSNSVPLANGEPQCKSTPSPTPQFKNFPNPDTFQFSLFSGSFVYKLS